MIKTKRITKISDKCKAPKKYIPINVLSWHKKDTKYYELSPYNLKTDGLEEQYNKGNILFENFWQGSKVYPSVYSNKVYSNWNARDDPNSLWWSYDAPNGVETHYDMEKNIINPKYFSWRDSIWNCKKPIRYPNSFKHKNEVIFSLLKKQDGTEKRLDYITSRIRIYSNEYKRLIRKLPIYKELLELTKNNNICIFEIDVPCKTKKGLFSKVNDDGTYDVTIEKINELIKDPSEPFGHGLCLAHAILEDIS